MKECWMLLSSVMSTRRKGGMSRGSKISRRVGSFKVAIIRLRDYLGLIQLFMVSALYFEGRVFEWWHYLIFLGIPVLWFVDKKFVHPYELQTIQLRSPVTSKMYEVALKIERWLEDERNQDSSSTS